MPQELFAVRDDAQVEAEVSPMCLYPVSLARGGWTKRVFLAGPDSVQARDKLRAALVLISARPADEPWPSFLSAAIAVLREAGFARTAH